MKHSIPALCWGWPSIWLRATAACEQLHFLCRQIEELVRFFRKRKLQYNNPLFPPWKPWGMGIASQTTRIVEVQYDPSYASYSCGEHFICSPASADPSHAKENTFRAKQEEVQQQDRHCQLFSKKERQFSTWKKRRRNTGLLLGSWLWPAKSISFLLFPFPLKFHRSCSHFLSQQKTNPQVGK